MKTLITIIAFVTVLVSGIVMFALRQDPLSDIPQSQRCTAMADRRDIGEICNLKGKTKAEIRNILGDPQNDDEHARVWIWVLDWDGYKSGGLSRDWKTMAANSPRDGL